ncbi:MAG: tRNA (adenosine(37)-N6)-dimethylallyltransferase MiaA [Planctomycetota bacterium]
MSAKSNDPVELALSCWFLTGATASGKSAVSIELAKMLDAEIISLDSMAIYRGMDIGTAKPTLEYQALLPHHLIDIRDPIDAFSVSQYRDLALTQIAEIQRRGKQVLFVGGTALYLKALLRGLFDGPAADWDLRKQIEDELEQIDSDELMKRLASVDPLSAHKLHKNDRRRIIRALEVYYRTGTPISHWQNEFDRATPAEQCRVFTLRHPRPILHNRIETRVVEMFELGLIEEVERLLKRWYDLGHTASQAVGYREVIEYLNGETDLETAQEKVLIRTRRFARHQETWFRGLEECQILDLEDEFSPASIAKQIYQLGESPSAS